MNPEKRKQTLIAEYGTWEAYKQHQAKLGHKGGKIGGAISPANFKNNPERAKLAGEKGRSVRDAKK